MQDEACTTYSADIDQMTLGHQFLLNHFGALPTKVIFIYLLSYALLILYLIIRGGRLIPSEPPASLLLSTNSRVLMPTL